jgi:hypothetical protein
MPGSGSWQSVEGRAFTDCAHCGWPSATRLFLPADGECERFAICRRTGCLSHVRICHFTAWDAGRHALEVWQRFLALAESRAFADCADAPYVGRDSLGNGSLESGSFALQCRTHLATVVVFSGSHR